MQESVYMGISLVECCRRSFLGGEAMVSVSSPPQLKTRMVRITTHMASSKSSTEAGKREPRGITKPRRISPAMQELLGVPEISRTQALKLIWAHIKEHNLQDPGNKRIIVCDEKLKKIFGGREQVGFLEISGLITPHFL